MNHDFFELVTSIIVGKIEREHDAVLNVSKHFYLLLFIKSQVVVANDFAHGLININIVLERVKRSVELFNNDINNILHGACAELVDSRNITLIRTNFFTRSRNTNISIIHRDKGDVSVTHHC